ncbi:MAG: hypothetical protein LBC84_03720, partial [Prevotellaceae bacterium]|nr:hypothetical protein [Prevotellaceae bacterium]
MKKLFFIVAAFLLIGVSCENTNINPVKDRGQFVVPIMSEPVPPYFTDNIEASFIQFDVSLAPGDVVDKAAIEVVNNGKSAIVKEVSLPVTGIKVTCTEVLKALGISESNYHTGDVFLLYVLTIKNGVTTRSTAAAAIPVICFFEPSMLVGTYDYVSDDWEEEGTVTMVADPNNPYRVFVHGYVESQGLPSSGNLIELILNPANYSVSGPKVSIAYDLSPWGIPSQDYFFQP